MHVILIDVIESLKNGHLKGYATDVIEDEYGDRGKSPILNGVQNGLNIIVTPHGGGMTWEGQQRAYKWAINNPNEVIKRIKSGQSFIEETYTTPIIKQKWEEIYNVCYTRNIG